MQCNADRGLHLAVLEQGARLGDGLSRTELGRLRML